MYRRSGMHKRYIGDEGVVDVRAFSLEGGTRKGLRQAVNRITNYGYTISFHDPARVAASAHGRGQGRHGAKAPGRGGKRLLDDARAHIRPPGPGLLLAVDAWSRGKPGQRSASSSLLPALAVTRSTSCAVTRGTTPTGSSTSSSCGRSSSCAAAGKNISGSNLATMRAVIAGEGGGGVQRWLLRRMSDSMQIESLWRFNAKFGPKWLPRYVVWGRGREHAADGACHRPGGVVLGASHRREILPTSRQRQRRRGGRCCELTLRFSRLDLVVPLGDDPEPYRCPAHRAFAHRTLNNSGSRRNSRCRRTVRPPVHCSARHRCQ